MDEQFKQFVHRNHRHEKWFELSKKLEGLPRHTSTHAKRYYYYDQPLYCTTNIGRYWFIDAMDDGSKRIGLLKIDFWGYLSYIKSSKKI